MIQAVQINQTPLDHCMVEWRSFFIWSCYKADHPSAASRIWLDQCMNILSGSIHQALAALHILATYNYKTLVLPKRALVILMVCIRVTSPETYGDVLLCADGKVTTTPTNQTTAIFEGGMLDALQSLTGVTIGHDLQTNDSWLFCSGVNGLTVLADPATGAGWGDRLGDHFSGIKPACNF